MKVVVKSIRNKSEEQVVLECVEMSREFENVRRYALGQGDTLTGYLGEKMYTVPLDSVLYFETVDEKVFAYTLKAVYEVRSRLYELEEAYGQRLFIRCSRQVVLNLMKLGCIEPEINGRFVAHMKNGEQLIISRQYVPALKKAVMGKEGR